ncbi:trimethylamine methyltransferase family protein, partial [candidate division WOR-3 bacterium]|nr:trimethylamine methyltransferase family protein [candidate division WOR-3 bacterium]
ESCQSLEKLVLDNEICGMTIHLLKGVEPKEDFPSLPRFQELLKEQHLLISEHTRRYLNEEFYFPGVVIDRVSRTRWQEEGSITLLERAHGEVKRIIKNYVSSRLQDDTKKELTKLMTEEAHLYGMKNLPEHE